MKLNQMSDNNMTWEQAVIWLRAQTNQQELVRFCYYDDPLEDAAERFNTSEEWGAVMNLLSPKLPGKVLDLGAGRGISSYAFAKAGCTVTALEPDPSPLVGAGAIRSLFSRTGLPVTIVEERGEQLPFADGEFDIVYGRAVFHHAGDLKMFCAEAKRVLKPGGRFIMTREHVISRKEDLPSFLKSHALHHLYGGEHAYLLDSYTGAMHSAGLRSLKVTGPFESPINYAPMTSAELRQMICRMYAGFLGQRLAGQLADWPVFTKWCKRRLSLKCDTPGRLCTFEATK